MSYDILMEKFPRLGEKLEAVQTLSNMGLIESDNFHLDNMKSHHGSNNFIRRNEKWLQAQIMTGLKNSEYNVAITNLVLEPENGTSYTNCFLNLFNNLNIKTVIQFSKNGYAVVVDNPSLLAEKLNKKEYNGTLIRAYEIPKTYFKIPSLTLIITILTAITVKLLF